MNIVDNIAINDLERDVLLALVSHAEESEIAVLQKQLEVAEPRRREQTGVGFYLYFALPPGTPKCKRDSFTVNAVNARLRGAMHGAGFVLFIRDGQISFLEGFTYDEPWPMDADVGYALF